MRLIVDTDLKTLTVEDAGDRRMLDLYTPDAFAVLSGQWLKVGWELKYTYTFSWLGRPVIQLPEDMVRAQEVVYRLQPDVIVETGVAHGGSLVFYASLCQLSGKGRVIGVDIEIRPWNRQAIQAHELSRLITLVEGDSTSAAVVESVKSLIGKSEKVLVFLDSCHTRDHVLRELEAYCPLVSVGSYIVVTDGIMRDLHDVPRGQADWRWNNPAAAASAFVATHPEYVLESPVWAFNESPLSENITHWPHAWLKRIR